MINSGMMANFAIMLEKYVINPKEWETCGAPKDLVSTATEGSDNGYSTAISYHPDYGWFGLGCGQGPFVWWFSMEYEEFEGLVRKYFNSGR